MNTTPSLPASDPQTLSEAEHQLLERLGAAVVTEWSRLPTPLQRALFEHAVATDAPNLNLLKAQMARFLHDHKNGSR